MSVTNLPPEVTDLEPGIAEVLRRRAARKTNEPYHARSEAEVGVALRKLLDHVAPDATFEGLARMGGGASKEQFVFDLTGNPATDGRYVLRMEPLQSISESDRRREHELLHAYQGLVPAPVPVWLDADGEYLGQPGAVMRFVGGVTKPTASGLTVSGLGTVLGPDLRGPIGDQFLEHLVGIHGLDWRTAELPSFSVPDADPQQAARWQVNWWAQVWREDRVQSVPMVALGERWLRDNLPACTDLVMVHGDYRTGNYLFDEDSRNITAILDWELAHIGDPHEDLAWAIQRLFGSVENGKWYAGGMYSREEFLSRYEEMSGRTVDPVALHFYEVLAAWECLVIVLGTGPRSALDQHNHQDILLTWLAAVGHIFHTEVCDLIERGPQS